jgi:L-fucose isomerase
MYGKNEKIRVGLVVTMSEDVWPEDFVNLVAGFIEPARQMLEKLGFEVITTGTLCRDIGDAREQGEYLRANRAEVLVNHVGTWTYANDSVIVSQLVDVPVIIWPSYSKDSLGIAGGTIVRGSHEEAGIRNYMVYGDYDDGDLHRDISTFCRGIAGATKLCGLRYGVGGTRSMGMMAAQQDPSQWTRDFGIDVDGYEQVLLLEKAKAYDSKDVDLFYRWMEKEFGAVEVSREVMEAQIRMFMALKDLIEKKQYDFISVKCLPELPYVYTTFCLAISMLNDSSNDGFGNECPLACACEADSNGALTMQILKNISNKTSLFTDILYLDYKDKIATLGNCGSQPTDFAFSRKDVRWVKEGFIGHEFKIGCACPRYFGKEGKVTIARLTRVNGKYHMLIASGESMPLNPDSEAEVGSKQHPKLFVKLDCNEKNFIEALRTNHMHLVYGDYKEELKITCDVLDIVPVVPE